MTKKILLILCGSTLVLPACTTSQPHTSQKIGMANPASQYCIEQGGKLEMKKNANGDEYANCILPDGRVVEEWQLFRQDHPVK
ncbi:DUF333 domain-containing protein [Acinetobacter guerrae]|uniref:DUF333 domain-containing protein n=1 Tax=Acinetobacter guerrae TaxID=1843371 RepID=A0A3A8EYN5_9GAMM|nr:DUF333 domain-containing protein [Acinetobacter guerrae]MPW44677.1 hemolysin [Acinetobacter guerrae]RKG35860.1 DUF333 domain-containing protein [Acinetobacter guerrae]